jgi:hypothetical protein
MSSPSHNISSSVIPSSFSSVSDLISEPYYTPSSPSGYDENDIVIPALKYPRRRRDRQQMPSFPKNITQTKFDRDIAVDQLSREVAPPAPEDRKKRKQKRRAENAFDMNAKPIKLAEFYDEVKDEKILPEIFLFGKENLTIEIANELEDPVVHEELALANLVVSKHNSNSDLDKQYGLKLVFDDHIEAEYLRSLELDPDYYDLTHLEFKASYGKIYDSQLFIERRLFSTLSHLQFSDKEFLKRSLPVKKDISRIDVSKLFNDDDNSIHVLKVLFKSAFDSGTTTSKLLNGHGPIKLKKLKDMMTFKSSRRFQRYLIAAYILFNDCQQLRRRHTKVSDLHEIFRNSIFKNSDISTIFNNLGIGFFGDYCSFNVIKPYIANLTENRHKQRYKELKKIKITEDKAKRRKENQDLTTGDLWFEDGNPDQLLPAIDLFD